MKPIHASASGTFKIGGAIEIHRLGYGAMRITGRGVWGPPSDKAEALRLLKALPELGINFIDTADFYGPDVSEGLIREALQPYDGLLVATKAGLVRGGPDQWTPNGRPDYLIQQARNSLKWLGVEQIGLWQLHRIDPDVPRDEQFGAVEIAARRGRIAHAGLSEVSIADIEAASKMFTVATVQNRYNLVDRTSEEVVDHCAAHGIGFIPWYPLAAGDLARPGALLDTLAKRYGATPARSRWRGRSSAARHAAHSWHVQAWLTSKRTSPRPASNSRTRISRPSAPRARRASGPEGGRRSRHGAGAGREQLPSDHAHHGVFEICDMKVATFNINNINRRLSNLLEWLKQSEPEIVCLQELKCADHAFPEEAIAGAGYAAVWPGQKNWNGVAILSRVGKPVLTNATAGDAADKQARYIEAAVNGVLICCLYLPNGNPQPGPKFDYKLSWFIGSNIMRAA